ncbi:hypothetical protein [Hydrogenophaga sp. RWCD_12]|uniref:hypothetical protein n=1 Tax=Hydrogenophaga sp. RWCD_12 TaxID=3391190 RepID=UPI0039847966
MTTIHLRLAAATLSLLCAAAPAGAQTTAPAASVPVETITVRPHWTVGEEVRYRITHRRETTRSGQPAITLSVESMLNIRVLAADAKGYRLAWRSSVNSDRPPSAETLATLDQLAQRMPETLRLLKEGQETEIVTDEDGLPIRLGKTDGLEKTAGVVRNELDAVLKAASKDAAVPEAVTGLVKGLMSTEAVARQQLAFAQAVLGVMGGEFEGQTPLEAPLTLENPLGQMLGAEAPPLKGTQRWQLESASDKELVIGYRVETDPESARKSLAMTLEKLSQKLGKAMPKDAVKGVSIQDSSRYAIDRASGWPERVTIERKVAVDASNGQGVRTDTRTIERIR